MISTGRCLPWRSVTNKDLSEPVETNDEWIFSRTGIRTRRFCGEETAGTFRPVRPNRRWSGQVSVRKSWELCGMHDHTGLSGPSEACLLQRRLGLPEDIPCFDLNAGCTGFLYGLQVIRGCCCRARGAMHC